LARVADKHAEGAGLKRQIEAKLADLENMKEDFNYKGRGSDFEFYKRLAGEAEARAVQKRLDLADVEAGGWGESSPDDFDPTDPVWVEHGAEMLKQEGKKVPTELYDVPLNELAFTGRKRSIPAKNQAKSDAQAILNQPGKMDESSFINKFTDNPNAAFWNKAELDKIKTEAGYGPDGIQDTFRAVRKANLKATIREMKKDGWDVQHTSTDSGKVSSYYLNKGGVDGPTIRVSDHELPETPERTHNRKIFGKPGWDEEFIINSKSSIEGIKKEVKDYLEWFNDV
jgi:hypothetical protein